MNTYLIHTQNTQVAEDIAQLTNSTLNAYDTHFRFQTNELVDLPAVRAKYQVDINLLPEHFDTAQVKAFVTDMDSTLISIECIDEIADYANLKPQVATITEQAMRGELDFNESLRARVALLKGLDVNVLEQVYTNKLTLNPGARELMNFLHQQNIYTAVVSGGFTYFTGRISHELGLNAHLSNTLEEHNNTLTGKALGLIINASEKAKFIDNLPYDNSQIITCGDGANDLEMMNISGLSVAYHAKQVVKDYADICIEFGGLDTIIDLLQ